MDTKVCCNSKASDWSVCKFGTQSGEDIVNFLALYRQIENEVQGLVADGLKRHSDVGQKPVAPVPAWAAMYEHPFQDLLAFGLKQMGMGDAVKQAAKAGNPSVEFMEIMKLEMDADTFELEDTSTFLGVWIAILANLDAIENYSQTMSDLIADLDKPDRCITSLCKALRIDSTVIGLPRVARLYFITQITENKAAENEIINALRGSPHKKRVPYKELRWVEHLLRESGAFESCRFEDIHELVVNGLGIYKPDGDKGDSLKSLQKLFTTWQKSAGTHNPSFR